MQIIYANNYIKQKFGKKEDGSRWKVRNVVFMGMGEPLANYPETIRAVQLLTHPRGFGIGQRNITISNLKLLISF